MVDRQSSADTLYGETIPSIHRLIKHRHGQEASSSTMLRPVLPCRGSMIRMQDQEFPADAICKE